MPVSLDQLYSQYQSQQPQSKPSMDDLYSQFKDQPNGDKASLKEQMKGEFEDVQRGVDWANTGIAKLATGKGLAERANEATAPNITQNTQRPFDTNVQGASQPLAQAGQVIKQGLATTAGQMADQVASPLGIATLGAGTAIKGINKTLDAAGEASGRLYDWMVKAPTKAFNYGKDPLGVMAKEQVTGNSITDLASNFKDRLAQRSQELQDAVKSSDKSVNVNDIVNKHLDDAASQAKGSLQERSAIVDKLNYMKDKISSEYGDLNNLSVQGAVKLKRQLADDFPFSGNTEENILAKTAHKMYHDINSTVEKVHPEIANLNESVSSLIDISKAAQNRVAIEARNNPLGLIHTMLGMGAAGGLVHGVEGGAAGITTALAAKAISSPAVLSRVAKGLSVLSNSDRISLFKTSPEFMPIVQAAHEFENSPEFAMAGKVGKAEENPEATPPKEDSVNKPGPDLTNNKGQIGSNNSQNIEAMKNHVNWLETEAKNVESKGDKGMAEYYNSQAELLKRNIDDASKSSGLKMSGLGSGAAITSALALSPNNAEAKHAPIDDNSMLHAILGEAENGKITGMRMMSSALRNNGDINAAHGAKSITEKNGLFYRTYTDGTPDRQIPNSVVSLAKQVVQDTKNQDYANGANHWFSKNDLKSSLVKKMIRGMKYTSNSGDNYFYKEAR